MANASGRAGPRKGRYVSRQVFGAAAPAALSLSSMHLFTTSARLSRSWWGLAFSVRIQHSRAARARVIGSPSSAAAAGLTACVGGVSGLEAVDSGLGEAACAFGASAADGPVPSVSHAASASAAVNTVRLAAARIVRIVETETSIKPFQQEVVCGPDTDIRPNRN